MRTGIDARFFGPKDKGFGRYTENLIKELEKILNDDLEFFIFLKKQRFDDYIPQNPNFHKVLADYRWYGFKEQIFYPLKLKKYNLDLMHFTHFNVPILYRRKFIVTIHDLILRHFPIRKGIKFWAYKRVFKHAIKNSEKVIAISEHTKQDILRHYKIDPNKIKVIYEGIS
jgi:glycosyltransferase involved in cell wall biosynthesis